MLQRSAPWSGGRPTRRRQHASVHVQKCQGVGRRRHSASRQSSTRRDGVASSCAWLSKRLTGGRQLTLRKRGLRCGGRSVAQRMRHAECGGRSLLLRADVLMRQRRNGQPSWPSWRLLSGGRRGARPSGQLKRGAPHGAMCFGSGERRQLRAHKRWHALARLGAQQHMQQHSQRLRECEPRVHARTSLRYRRSVTAAGCEGARCDGRDSCARR